MILVTTESVNPAFNLAMEEYLLKQKKEEIFFLWRNSPSIIIGKNQNAYSEIDVDYVKEKNITVIRRLTGGGAVFHDLGNINFTFIANVTDTDDISFQRFTAPIINYLNTLGAPAQFSGRNDIAIDGQKISGNAQTKYKNRFMHHGTLLFGTDMTDLSKALTVNPLKIASKGIKSVRARVTNIQSHISGDMDVTGFMEGLYDYMEREYPEATPYVFTEDDIDAIEKLYKEKYSTWGWNFGENPDYTFKKCAKFDGGLIEITMTVKDEVIESIAIYGDFFAYGEMDELNSQLKGVTHNEDAIRRRLENIDLKKYIGKITEDELISTMF